MQQKFKERNSIDMNNFVDDKTKLFERFIKKQKGKPPKVIESELLLLRSGDLDRCFTSTGVCKFMCVAQKYSGQYFGELALTNDKPRAASIIALTDLIVLSLSKVNYKVKQISSLESVRVEHQKGVAKDRLFHEVVPTNDQVQNVEIDTVLQLDEVSRKFHHLAPGRRCRRLFTSQRRRSLTHLERRSSASVFST